MKVVCKGVAGWQVERWKVWQYLRRTERRTMMRGIFLEDFRVAFTGSVRKLGDNCHLGRRNNLARSGSVSRVKWQDGLRDGEQVSRPASSQEPTAPPAETERKREERDNKTETDKQTKYDMRNRSRKIERII